MSKILEYMALVAIGSSFAVFVGYEAASMISDSLNSSAAMIANARP